MFDRHLPVRPDLDQLKRQAKEHGDPVAPVTLLLQTYSRGPAMKHRCLETSPNTASCCRTRPSWHSIADASICCTRTCSGNRSYSAAHGRIGTSIRRNSAGAADESFALHGTPLAGTTLRRESECPRFAAEAAPLR